MQTKTLDNAIIYRDPAQPVETRVADLLSRLQAKGYQGILALEPHLAIAGHSSGFSGPEGMAYAAKKLREVMSATGCIEVA